MGRLRARSYLAWPQLSQSELTTNYSTMPSIGESDISAGSWVVGTVRVHTLYAGSAVYPRLCFRISISLRHQPSGISEAPRPIEIPDVHGELRLGQHSDGLAILTRMGERRALRSSPEGFDTQVELACELDPYRLELIERRRGGAPPLFWLQIWPTTVAAAAELVLSVPVIELHVQQQTWLDFLKATGVGEYEIVEIQYGPAEREYFRRGIERVREARLKITEGEYDEAVSLCRKVLEAAGHDLSPGRSDSALKDLFIRAAGDKRGGEYAGVLSKVKQLASFVHHDFGSHLTYSRSEAQFIIRVTESLLSLASHFAAHTPPPPAAREG
ncbi:MAG: hypothetical protein JWM41_4067 [Gemmatimonadetes bacterium]|nr:hypothetical protein [Gemmatimonadota bacterium]